MTEQQSPMEDPSEGGAISTENYAEILEKEIVRRIEIMESPDYQGVKKFNRTDTICAVALAALMLTLIILGARI